MTTRDNEDSEQSQPHGAALGLISPDAPPFGPGSGVCEVYVHNVPTIGKIVIACGQMPFVILICFMVSKSSKLRLVMGLAKIGNGPFSVS